MKRMNVREFRKNVSALNQETIEVVRYSETIGFWVPQSMTTEPIKGPRVARATRRPTMVTRKSTMADEELKEALAKVRAIGLAVRRRGLSKTLTDEGLETKGKA